VNRRSGPGGPGRTGGRPGLGRRTAALVLAAGLVVSGTAGCGPLSGATATGDGSDGEAATAVVTQADLDAVEEALDAAEQLASQLEQELASDAPAPS